MLDTICHASFTWPKIALRSNVLTETLINSIWDGLYCGSNIKTSHLRWKCKPGSTVQHNFAISFMHHGHAIKDSHIPVVRTAFAWDRGLVALSLVIARNMQGLAHRESSLAFASLTKVFPYIFKLPPFSLHSLLPSLTTLYLQCGTVSYSFVGQLEQEHSSFRTILGGWLHCSLYWCGCKENVHRNTCVPTLWSNLSTLQGSQRP